MYTEKPPQARPQTMYSATSNIEVANSRPKSMMVSSELSAPVINKDKPVSSSSLNTVKENVPPPRSKKRRAPAPPPAQIPPQKTIQVEISVEKQNLEKKDLEDVTDSSVVLTSPAGQSSVPKAGSNKFHSRNSSDSSGYHELTLSGAESPDAARLDVIDDVQMHIDSTSLDSGEHMNGDSGIRDISPPRRKQHQRATIMSMDVGASQTLPLSKDTKTEPVRSRSLERDKKKGAGKKKKAAPPPPTGKLTLSTLSGIFHYADLSRL